MQSRYVVDLFVLSDHLNMHNFSTEAAALRIGMSSLQQLTRLVSLHASTTF